MSRVVREYSRTPASTLLLLLVLMLLAAFYSYQTIDHALAQVPFSERETSLKVVLLIYGSILALSGVLVVLALRSFRERNRLQQEAQQKASELAHANMELRSEHEQLQRLLADLEEANRRLKRLGALKDEFVAQVSHELRTPMAIIREGIAQILEGICGQPSPVQSETLAVALRNIDRLERLIEDLLDLSKIESGKLPLARVNFDLVELVREVCRSFDGSARAKSLELRIRVPQSAVWIFADREKVGQVFWNLLDNASKFTARGYIEVSIERRGDQVHCSVFDTGPGIPKEHMPRLFGKFEQLGTPTAGIQKGTGLGLAICKGVVEMHGGRIWAESALNQNTRFSFVLPAPQRAVLHAA